MCIYISIIYRQYVRLLGAISSEIIRNAMAEIKKKGKRGIFRIKVARFKGSYDTHTHISIYTLL